MLTRKKVVANSLEITTNDVNNGQSVIYISLREMASDSKYEHSLKFLPGSIHSFLILNNIHARGPSKTFLTIYPVYY